MIVSKIRLLFFAGVAAIPIALTSCADPQATGDFTTTTPVETSPEPSTPVAVPGLAVVPAIDINTASEEDLKKLADKLGVSDLAEKIEEKRPYNDINELASKEVISPEQLEYIKDDIVVKDVPKDSEEKPTEE